MGRLGMIARSNGAVRRPKGDGAPIVVQLSLPKPDGTTKYVDQLVDGSTAAVEYRFFTWRATLAGGYDVLHVHWPELMIRARNPLKRFARRRAMDTLLLLLRLRRVPLVRTVHNMAPHEHGDAAERRMLERIDRATAHCIVLNELTTLPVPVERTLVPHGHYRAQFARFGEAERVSGRIVYFGLIRPYKGVQELISVFAETADPDLSLHVVGKPAPGMADGLTAAAARDPRTTLRLAYVDDEELVAEVTASELVVLPYREMHNSGALLVALSLDRPALVPDTPANRLMQDEVGEHWIRIYSGELDASVLEPSLVWARGVRDGRPDLSGRDWERVGELHEVAYRAALGAPVRTAVVREEVVS